MTFLKIVLSSLTTAALAAVVVGVWTLINTFATQPNQGAVGNGIVQAFGAGMVAAVAGLILGIAGSLLFPASYLKFLAISVLIGAGLLLLGWRVITQQG